MSKRAKQIIIACSVPVIILLGMCIQPLYTLLKGEEIILQTRPFDPSDPFRGDYVNLFYEAEQVSAELVDRADLKKIKDGLRQATVYVLLEKKNGVHTPVKATLKKPEKGIYLKGKVNGIGPNGSQKEVVLIQYSLDKYFVEDNTGTDWERASTEGGLLAKVKVSPGGYAYLTDIIKKK